MAATASAGSPGTQSRTFVHRFASAPEAVWPLLADTARFNEAAKLPKHEIEEIARADGSVEFLGRARIGPFRLAWDDRPVNWVAPRWLEHRREFRRGPLRLLAARLVLSGEGAGCRAEYTVEAAPANPLGRLLLATRFFPATGRMFLNLAGDAERFLAGANPMPFSYRPPPASEALSARVEGLVAQIEGSGHGHGLARRLADHVLQAQEVDLVRIRPLKLARDWGAAPREAIELCLEAARAGLLALRWDVLCPRCRIGKAPAAALDEVPAGVHCDTCNVSYARDFSRNVEVSFTPAAQVRPIETGEWCLFGPVGTPHVWAQVTLAPGARRVLALDLPAGAYRVRTLDPGPEQDLELDGGGLPGIVLEPGAIRLEAPATPGQAALSNRDGRARTLVVEERRWLRDALTADRVANMQAFRDLFSDQVLRPGDEVAIARVALMFTDLRGSTALYAGVGDAAAYHLVREHFAFLTGIVRAHNGAVVKTIGDAIMAAFGDPADALGAALEVQRHVAAFNRGTGGRDLTIKLGLHQGPCIAVTLNGRLDYFGTTVNMAARLQGQSTGGDIVLSREIAADPALGPLLEGLARSEESVALKGFDRAVTFLRLAPERRRFPRGGGVC